MLPVKHRLLKREDFKKVLRYGTLFSFENLSLKFLRNSTQNSRIGFLVGKKTAKKAAERNTIKRKLRGVFLEKMGEIRKGFDIIVSCNYREKKGEKFKLKKSQIEKLLKKSHLLE